MSGPKLSAAELERLRQEQLERERIAALLRLQNAQTSYRDTCAKMKDAQQYLQSQMDQVDALYRGTVKNEIGSLLAMLNIPQIYDDKDAEQYENAVKQMDQAIAYVTAGTAPVFDKYLKVTKADQKLRSANADHQSFTAYLSANSDPVDIKKLDFTANYGQQQLQALLDQTVRHYQWLVKNGKNDQLRQFAAVSLRKLQQILADPKALDQAAKVKGSVQKIVNDEAELQRQYKEFSDLYDSYVAIATMMSIVPQPSGSFAGIQALQKETDRLRQLYRKKDEMDYIADQINDAMISLGYGFVTSSVLVRQDQSEADCSLYQADDKTGIAIYTDQSGAVMMRMTVLGDSPDITDEDRDFSFQRQIDFCSAHPDIVNALAERGVYLKATDYKAPDRKYTYKFAGDAMSAVAKDANGQTVLKKTKVDRRKRRRADKKKMRAL